jgi:hypothetical protein
MKKIMFLIFSLFIVICSFPQKQSNANKIFKCNKNLKFEIINTDSPSFIQMYYYDHNRVIEIVSACVYFVLTSETGGTSSDFFSGKVHLWHHIAYNNTNFDTIVSINNKQQFDVLNNYVCNLLSNKSSNSNGVFAGTKLEYIFTIKDKQYKFKRRNYYSLYELLINNDTK